MSRSLKQEIEFVAGALTHSHALQDLLDMPGKWTAAMRRDVHEKVAALTGHMLVADFALTGDEAAVRSTMEDIHAEALYRLAA